MGSAAAVRGRVRGGRRRWRLLRRLERFGAVAVIRAAIGRIGQEYRQTGLAFLVRSDTASRPADMPRPTSLIRRMPCPCLAQETDDPLFAESLFHAQSPDDRIGLESVGLLNSI